MVEAIARIAVLGVSLLACLPPPIAPRHYEVKHKSTVSSSYEATWNALIDTFADHQWTITTIDKSSGLITTDWMVATTESPAEPLADCGAPVDTSHPLRVRFNVRVKPTGDSTSVSVNVGFRRGDNDCNSTGVAENRVRDGIAAAIEDNAKPAAGSGASAAR